MPESDVRDLYFLWLCDMVDEPDEEPHVKLLAFLHEIPFRYSIPMDANRATDGIDLRYRFAYGLHHKEYELYFHEPCSVLEMLIALSLKCEEQIMSDPEYGNRTSLWFWNMLANLGVCHFTDSKFDKDVVAFRINMWLDRKYGPHGEGGLFYVPSAHVDLRGVDIWYQMLWYLDENY